MIFRLKKLKWMPFVPDTDEIIERDLRASVAEVIAHKKGKIELTSAKDLEIVYMTSQMLIM